MINTIPKNWNYDENLEMLFLLYQSTDELLSEVTPDTFALPLHNPLTLVNEIAETYFLLKKYDIIKDYYEKYIPPIIDELLSQIPEDYILKIILGKRLDSIITGLRESKKAHILLERWLNIFMQSCSIMRYTEAYKEEIIRLVIETKEKNNLILCLKKYYVSLLYVGYSREHLYVSAKRFFDNNNIAIDNPAQVKKYLELFSCKSKEFEFLILMDTDNVDYLDSINSSVIVGQDIQKVNIEKERKQLDQDPQIEELVKKYERMKSQAGKHQKIAIVRLTDRELDPYKSAVKFCDYISFLQTFKRYFIHYGFKKHVYQILLRKDNGSYVKLTVPNKVRKRPYVEQSIIDERIKNILSAKSLGRSAFSSLAQALELHADALDSKNTMTLLKSLWTALETLFSTPNASSIRDNVINSTICIVQKTYILKVLRALYSQVCDAIPEDCLKQLEILDFASFVQYFSSYNENSTEMKKLYNHLSHNPLLRARIFAMRKSFKDGKHICSVLDKHKERVEWQLQRISRTRNIATHIGIEVAAAECVANHLHNYFDYIVNYMLCKSENGNYIADVSTLVFETKNDLSIQRELLKENECLSENNYKFYLFGPDLNMAEYNFEY